MRLFIFCAHSVCFARLVWHDTAVCNYNDNMTSTSASPVFSAIITAPFGAVGIRSTAALLQEIVYLPSHFPEKEASDACAAEVAQQLRRYLQQADHVFNLPPLPVLGSAFQRRVWAAIATIPCGEVRTYGQLARQLQSAPRAVGQACGANWFPLLIPCHRVIAAAGLGGFARHASADGFHAGVKRWLLAHEGVHGY